MSVGLHPYSPVRRTFFNPKVPAASPWVLW